MNTTMNRTLENRIEDAICKGLCVVHAYYECGDDFISHISYDANTKKSSKGVMKSTDSDGKCTDSKVSDAYQYVVVDSDGITSDNINTSATTSATTADIVFPRTSSNSSVNSHNSASSVESMDDKKDVVTSSVTSAHSKDANVVASKTVNKIKTKTETFVKIDKGVGQRSVQGMNVDIKHNFIHDFSNFEPSRARILRGSGYIRTISGEQYVITCNHIMVKYALSYKGYCYDLKGNMSEFEMCVHRRIPELDIVIMRIITKLDNPLPELDRCRFTSPVYSGKLENKIVSYEYIPSSVRVQKGSKHAKVVTPEMIAVTSQDVNDDIIITFDTLKSKYLKNIPSFNIPVRNMKSIKTLAKTSKIDYDKAIKTFDYNRMTLSKTIGAMFAGTSGGIVCSAGVNIGMICMFIDIDSGFYLKALPLNIIDALVENILYKIITNINGIQIDTYGCEIEYMKEQIYGHYVVRQSSSYGNGKKLFSFNDGDIILEVDGKRFNKEMMIWSNFLDMFVPLNTYTFIRSNIELEITYDDREIDRYGDSDETDEEDTQHINPTHRYISFKIAKQYQDDTKIRLYNLASIAYDDMYKFRINDGKYLSWNGHIFTELSEEMIEFYRRLGLNIVVSGVATNMDRYANDKRDKIVVLLNYKKTVKDVLNEDYFKSLPVRGSEGVYFYVLTFVGQKKISCLVDLATALDSAKDQRQVTMKLVNDCNITKSYKISLETKK